MIKSITKFRIIFFIFQQLKSQISQIDQNGVNPFCDETLHIKVQNNLSEQCTVFKVVISFGKIVIFLSRYRKIYSQLLLCQM